MDRELLELAAKAAKYDVYWGHRSHQLVWNGKDGGHEYPEPVFWNPLTDDGDALRLAVKLNIDLRFYPDSEITEPWVETAADGGNADEALSPDPYAATRRAIVRAAADIGRTMP